jgi:hypothetical protein
MSEAKTTAPHVYTAIAEVTEKLGKHGIAKDRENTQGSGYKFRGIDDVLNALSPCLSAAKLCILPRVLERTIVERTARSGGGLFYITVKVDFDFVSAVDGSKHVITTYGEAMDSGDKATNKAMSAAYKYAAFQAFCIPTEGDNDADASTHEVKPAVEPEAEKAKAAPPAKKQSPAMIALQVALKEALINSKEGRLKFCAAIAGREIASSNDLTPDELAACTAEAKRAKATEAAQ